MNKLEIEKYNKAGKITSEVVEYAKSIVKKDVLLIELAEKIEQKIYDLGGKPAFPVNLSINEVAAHATPSYNDESKAHGLLKVDIGVHIEGFAADTAFSVDLEDNEVNKGLIESAEDALKEGLKIVKHKIELREIGKVISERIKSKGFMPVVNLSGHAIKEYDLHAGVNVPNYDNGDDSELEEGVYAIEPFSTNGSGKVIDGRPSGIYQVVKQGNVRDNMAREVLKFIVEEYKTLPFCSRWIHKKFGGRGLLGLRFIEQAGLLHGFTQLVEISHGIVAQAEHTIIVQGNEVIVTTK